MIPPANPTSIRRTGFYRSTTAYFTMSKCATFLMVYSLYNDFLQIIIYVRRGPNVQDLVTDAEKRFNINLKPAASKLQVTQLKHVADILLQYGFPDVIRCTLLIQFRHATAMRVIGHAKCRQTGLGMCTLESEEVFISMAATGSLSRSDKAECDLLYL